MPEMSTVRSFVEAIRTRQTTSTRGLRALWNARDQEAALTRDLATIGVTPLDGRLRTALKAHGQLTDAQVDHIDSWPDVEKLKARDALAQALADKREAQFFWELYDGTVSVSEVQNARGPGDTIIVFLSPRANLRLDSTFNLGAVKVDVVP